MDQTSNSPIVSKVSRTDTLLEEIFVKKAPELPHFIIAIVGPLLRYTVLIEVVTITIVLVVFLPVGFGLLIMFMPMLSCAFTFPGLLQCTPGGFDSMTPTLFEYNNIAISPEYATFMHNAVLLALPVVYVLHILALPKLFKGKRLGLQLVTISSLILGFVFIIFINPLAAAIFLLIFPYLFYQCRIYYSR